MKTFPDYLEQVEGLISDHKELKDHELVLAIYYDVPRQPNDVYVLEVLLQVGLPTDDTEFYDAEYSTSPAFPLDGGSTLHVVLTDNITFMRAKDWNWPQFNEIRDAVHRSCYRVIYQNKNLGSDQLLSWLTDNVLV